MYNPREAQRDFLYLRNVILIAFILMGTFVAANNAGQGLPYAVLWLDGERTTGKIVDTTKSLPGGIRSVSYSYRGTGDATHIAKKKYSSFAEVTLDYGDPVEVRYSRHFPNISTITPLWSHMRYEFTFMVSGLVVVVIAGGLTFFAVFSIVKHKLQDRRY